MTDHSPARPSDHSKRKWHYVVAPVPAAGYGDKVGVGCQPAQQIDDLHAPQLTLLRILCWSGS